MTDDPRDMSLIPATIKEAIDAWKNGCRKGDATEVFFAYNYGDYWRTEVAEPVEGVEERDIKKSAMYGPRLSETVTELDYEDQMADEDDEDESTAGVEESPYRSVVILS